MTPQRQILLISALAIVGSLSVDGVFVVDQCAITGNDGGAAITTGVAGAGGAMWSDQFKPGPIYLQGDHGTVSYRNLVLRPVVK